MILERIANGLKWSVRRSCKSESCESESFTGG